MSTTLEQLQYGFDRDSRRTWRQRATTQGWDNAYVYDSLSQVIGDDRGDLNLAHNAIAGIPANGARWQYDETGNWHGYQTKVDGATALTQSRTHDKGNRLMEVSEAAAMRTDRTGRMLETVPGPGGDWSTSYKITWDAWSRITAVESVEGDTATPVAAYAYDGLTRRITRHKSAQNMTLQSYYNDEWRPVEERRDGDSLALQYLWGSRHRDDLVRRDTVPVAGGAMEDTHYVLMDYFSPAAVVDVSGDLIERYQFSAFGLRTILTPSYQERAESEIGFEFSFQGQFEDVETGWLNFGYRYYLPALGRWACKDPIGELGGNNLYVASGNNTENFVDQVGLLYMGPTVGMKMSTSMMTSMMKPATMGGSVMAMAAGVSMMGIMGTIGILSMAPATTGVLPGPSKPQPWYPTTPKTRPSPKPKIRPKGKRGQCGEDECIFVKFYCDPVVGPGGGFCVYLCPGDDMFYEKYDPEPRERESDCPDCMSDGALISSNFS